MENSNKMYSNAETNLRSQRQKTAMGVDQIGKTADETREANEMYSKPMKKEWSIWEQIAQRDMYKAVVESRKELFNANAEHRTKIHKEILDARLGALREQTQAGLMMIRGHYRREVATYMSGQMEALVMDLGEKRESLFLKMAKNYDFIEKLNGNEFLINRYLTSIQNETEMVIGTMEKLAQNFEKSIMDQVSKYRSEEIA